MNSNHNPRIHHRRSIRLKGYDYSQEGLYFVTIVTQGRKHAFGEVVDSEMRLNECGEIVQKWWQAIPGHFPNVNFEIFIVMPNHVHGIITIEPRRGEVLSPQGTAQGTGTVPLQDPTLGQVIAYFKYQTTKEINALHGGPIKKIWQRNYYEHIIRNQHDLEVIWRYIQSNPARWAKDAENAAGH